MTERNSTALHLLSSQGPGVLGRCEARLEPGDAVVLMADGVLLATLTEFHGLVKRQSKVHWLALAPDAAARGLDEVISSAGLEPVDDDGVVELMARHEHCLGWS